jgi:hypothetical protein
LQISHDMSTLQVISFLMRMCQIVIVSTGIYSRVRTPSITPDGGADLKR